MSFTAMWFAILLLAFIDYPTTNAGGCWPPKKGCECTFQHYPCYKSFSYGCKRRYCWAQCAAILGGCKEWCWVKSHATGNYLTCDKNSDCKDGADCALAECFGGCTVYRQNYLSFFLEASASRMEVPESED